jgi:hypothetical protein
MIASGHADRISFAESYNTHQYSLKNQEAALNFLDRFNNMPLRHGLPPVATFSDADLYAAEIYQSEQNPNISSWTVVPYTGSSSRHEIGWEAVGNKVDGRLHIDRYLLYHSTYLEMPLLHFYKDGNPPMGHSSVLVWREKLRTRAGLKWRNY